MGIGVGLAGVGKAVVLLSSGAAQLSLGELATAMETQSDLVFILMNDRGYGVIRNIQDAQYGGRHDYANILTPDFSLVCQAIGLPHQRLSGSEDFAALLDAALALPGPRMIEVDMLAISPFAERFAGPPVGASGRVR